MNHMPTPVIAHATIWPPADACCAMFCGRLKMPPPTIADTTSANRPTNPTVLRGPAAAAPEPSTIAGALDACCPLSAIVNPLLLCACMPTSERNR